MSVLVTVLLSMGKHFPLLNEPLFNYLPLYSKFRAPSSILGLTALLFTILGILGLSEVLKTENKETLIKPLAIATGIASVFCLFFLLLGGSMFDFSSAGDGRLAQAGYSLGAIVADRKSLMQGDSLRTLLFVLATSGLIFAYLKDKLKTPVLLLGIGLLVLGDLWTVGKRYLSTEDFEKPKTVASNNFTARAVDQQIFSAENIALDAKSGSLTSNGLGRGGYRVLDLSINTFNSSITSYYHNTIGGYHAAKLQRFQDLIENHISKNNIMVLNMLNTKYIITREQQLQTNPNALGNAWFVDNIIKVNTPNEEIDRLNSFDPKSEAIILDSEFPNYIGDFNPTKQGSISLTSYHPTRLEYTSTSNSEQLAVFSEVWYGPDKGWKVTIDGEPASHIRANYALRAMRIPAGTHKIAVYMEPDGYYTAAKVSKLSSFLLLLLFFGVLAYSVFQWWKNIDEKELVKIVTPKKLVKTERQRGKLKKKGKNKK